MGTDDSRSGDDPVIFEAATDDDENENIRYGCQNRLCLS